MSHVALNTSVCPVFVHRTESLVPEPRLTVSGVVTHLFRSPVIVEDERSLNRRSACVYA